MVKKIMTLVLLTLFILPTYSFPWFGPKNFDECIIEGMKGVTSDVAARAIYLSCANKYQAKQPKQTRLPNNQVKLITGMATIGNRSFYGNIYNGVGMWSISSIVVSLRHNDTVLERALPGEKYTIAIEIPPYSSRDFNVLTSWVSRENDSWQIEEVYGMKVGK